MRSIKNSAKHPKIDMSDSKLEVTSIDVLDLTHKQKREIKKQIFSLDISFDSMIDAALKYDPKEEKKKPTK